MEKKRKQRSAQKGRRSKQRRRVAGAIKVLLCYLLCFGLALGLPLAGLQWIYPYRLVGTAPGIARHVMQVLPFLNKPLLDVVNKTTLMEGMAADEITGVLAMRDDVWRIFVALCLVIAWILSVLLQLLWRGAYRRPLQLSRVTHRAIRTYRMTLLGIVVLNVLAGLMVYVLGVRFIAGRTLWDWLLYMGGFFLIILAAWACFRFAAPPAISGKRAFFKRL